MFKFIAKPVKGYTVRDRNITKVKILGLILMIFGMITEAHAETPNAENTRKSGTPQAQYTAEGTKHCVRCHSGERIVLIGKTVHGNKDNPHTPYAKQGCESCHGPGSLHVSRARGGRGFPLLIAFRQSEPAQRHTDACVNCHANDMGKLEAMEWAGSVHAIEDITCVNCHQLHVDKNPLKDSNKQREVCAKCHSKQITNHRRYESVGIAFDKLTCFECHDVHQLIRKPK